MVIRACIFDLFGTLVPILLMKEYYGALRAAARAIGADEDDFLREWRETYRERNLGQFSTLGENAQVICDRLGVKVQGTSLSDALDPFLQALRETLRPKPESEEVLARIRRRGYLLGLISNANPAVPDPFKQGPLAPFFQEMIFSADIGMMKPDPAIYVEMARRLTVAPSDCLYIGDGHEKELAGASGVGMATVLVDYDLHGNFIWERDEEADYTIRDLREILSILDQIEVGREG
jgi:putative hydrolase of the HAD superfamily